jgi:putative component of membrane protein insertase Oxa1/YidC/SpoIIIJ protein YidD
MASKPSRNGIAKGLALSVHRIHSCGATAPMGTIDPVKERRSLNSKL